MVLRRIRHWVFSGFTVTLIAVSVFAHSADTAPSSPPAFTLQDLGPLPFVADDVLPGLSDTGRVCFWQSRREAIQGVAWFQGETKSLGSIAGYPSSMPHAINASGEIAGWTGTSVNSVDSRAVTRACLWRGSTLTLLGTLGGQNSQAFGINSQNTVVGVAQCADGSRHAFITRADAHHDTQHDALHDLGTLPSGTFSQAYAINAAGHAVGVSNSVLPYKHAVCWRDGQVHDLGLLPGGKTSSAQAINARDQIAGYADTPDGTHAFLYTQGKMQDLGTLGEAPSNAAALNDQGQVVGSAGFANDQHHAFLWQNGVMFDLNKRIAPGSPWILLRACAINNHGQIVCLGHVKDNLTAHILFLTPISAHAD